MKNIIFIVIECLRPKNLSLFGYEKETDINLKKIAKESILFKQYFSVSNATIPSITSIFTGKYPNNIGMVHQIPYTTKEDIEKLRQNKFWMPSYFKEKGYSTISLDKIGLWMKRGFDDYPQQKESKIKEFIRKSFIRKILLALPSWFYSFAKKFTKLKSSPIFPPAKELVDSAINKIQKSKKPFFLYMRFEDTHFPFLSSIKTESSGKNEVDKILNKIKTESQKEYVKKRFSDVGLYSLEDIKNKYDSGLIETDVQIGRFVEFLKSENLWDNTILIILGDHGENFDEHGIYFSRSGIYDTSIHTFLMMYLPGLKNKEVESFVQNTDIAPTILDYLKTKNPNKLNFKFDGKSLISLIKTNKPIRNKIFAFDCFSDDTECVRTKNRKLIVSKNPICYLCKAQHHSHFEEYDLKKDSEELNNIYNKDSKLGKFLKLNKLNNLNKNE